MLTKPFVILSVLVIGCTAFSFSQVKSSGIDDDVKKSTKTTPSKQPTYKPASNTNAKPPLVDANTSGMQGSFEAYKQAANAYKEAAAKTKCPQKRAWLIAMSNYQNCVYMNYSNGKSDVTCSMPGGSIPDCPEDENSSGSGFFDDNSSSIGFTSGQTYSNTASFQNAINEIAVDDPALANKMQLMAAGIDLFSNLTNLSEGKSQLLGTIGLTAMPFLDMIFKGAKEKKMQQQQQQKQEEYERKQKENLQMAFREARNKFYGTIPMGKNPSSILLENEKEIWVYFFAYPKSFIGDEGYNVYLTKPVKVNKYSDDTWPLMRDMLTKFSNSLSGKINPYSFEIKVRSYFRTAEEISRDLAILEESTKNLGGSVEYIGFKWGLQTEEKSNNTKKSFWDDN